MLSPINGTAGGFARDRRFVLTEVVKEGHSAYWDESGYGRYGKTVRRLALSRGYGSVASLAAEFNPPDGKPLRAERLRRWLRDVHEPPSWVNEDLADKLGLTDEERRRLAWANTFRREGDTP